MRYDKKNKINAEIQFDAGDTCKTISLTVHHLRQKHLNNFDFALCMYWPTPRVRDTGSQCQVAIPADEH